MFYTIVLGYLGGDAVYNEVANTKHNAIKFSLAHTETQGEKEVTTWFDCTLWTDKSQPKILEYLKKGSRVLVRGKIKPQAYMNKQNELVASLSLTVFDLSLC